VQSLRVAGQIMINGSFNQTRQTSLMNEYASLLGGAVLRHRTHVAEHSARIEAELASRIKSEFIANMSHELRTPLNTIIGFSKLISQQDVRNSNRDEVIAHAHLIQDAAGHLLAVINDILDISKIQSGKFALNSREVFVDEFLEPCVHGLALAAKEAKVNLTCDIDDTLKAICGDTVKLRQVFINLISNAIKFTPEGGAVTVMARSKARGRALITVRDSGVGMTEDEIQVAVTPFGQVDGGRNRWREGTGLGLPIARALVQLHGGDFEIKSEKGVGTEVMITLPLYEEIVPEPRSIVGV
jgi:two-component system, cell cycle sensor histidine kinase PleC